MKENTRQKLIDITFEEIYSHGYQGASLADILKKAGVHKGSMYHYFKNKKEMALSAIVEKMDEKFKTFTHIVSLDNNIIDQFFSIAKDTSRRDFKRGCPIANIVQEMSNIDEDFNKTMKIIYDKFRKNFQSILDRAIEIGELKACDTKKLALYTSAVIEGAILAAKASGNEQDYLDCIEILEEYLITLKV